MKLNNVFKLYIKAFKNYANFKGRSTRKEYLYVNA